MTNKSLTLEIPWQIKRHAVAARIQRFLDRIAPGEWNVQERELISTTIVPTAHRVRTALRQWADGEEMRFHVVVQTMRPVVNDRFEYLCPLVFMAAASREGTLGSIIYRDPTALPEGVDKTLERAQRMFGDIKPGPFRRDFDCAVRIVQKVVEETGWYKPELQRFWHSLN